MAAIKSYTDIGQAKKLAEILPLESADMWYSIVDNEPFVCLERHYEYEQIPCWSLAALLGILSFPALRYDEEDGDGGWIVGCEKNDKGYLSYYRDNPVDACYEMLIQLYKLNLL